MTLFKNLLFTFSLIVLTVIATNASAAIASSPVVEVVLFHVKPQITFHSVIEKANQVTPLLKKQPGYLSRSFGYAQNKHAWVDIIRWRSMQDATRAANKTTHYAVMQRFVAIMQDYKMYHFVMVSQ